MVDLQDIRNGLKSAYDEITKKIESNKIIKAVVSAGVLSILQGIPVVGPLGTNVYTNATGSDDYKSNQDSRTPGEHEDVRRRQVATINQRVSSYSSGSTRK